MVCRLRRESFSGENKHLPANKVLFPEFRLEDPALFQAVKQPSDIVRQAAVRCSSSLRVTDLLVRVHLNVLTCDRIWGWCAC